MAMAAITPPVITIDALLALPEDGFRHELLDGVHAVTPAPRHGHQRLVVRLLLAFGEALVGRRDFEVLVSPADLVLGPRTLVQPDLFLIRSDPEGPPVPWSEMGVPVLAVEVVSPGTAARDRGAKRRIYQAAGVGESWAVDPDARLVERWMPGDVRPEILDTVIVWAPDGAPLVSLDLGALFRPA
jgi:Uma2 family endonuclease